LFEGLHVHPARLLPDPCGYLDRAAADRDPDWATPEMVDPLPSSAGPLGSRPPERPDSRSRWGSLLLLAVRRLGNRRPIPGWKELVCGNGPGYAEPSRPVLRLARPLLPVRRAGARSGSHLPSTSFDR